jgi:hypothetical protein
MLHRNVGTHLHFHTSPEPERPSSSVDIADTWHDSEYQVTHWQFQEPAIVRTRPSVTSTHLPFSQHIFLIISISYGLGLVACSNSELLLKLWIFDIWYDFLDEWSARRKADFPNIQLNTLLPSSSWLSKWSFSSFLHKKSVFRAPVIMSFGHRPCRSKESFLVLTAASMKMAVFWDVAPCSLVEIDRRFRGAYSLCYQGFPSRPTCPILGGKTVAAWWCSPCSTRCWHWESCVCTGCLLVCLFELAHTPRSHTCFCFTV